MRIKRTVALAVVALSLIAASSASASSIVYIKDGNVYLTSPDGATGYQVTYDGGWDSPSQADDGTILAIKNEQLYRLSPSGQVIGAPFDTVYSGGAGSPFHGPFGARISPDGSKLSFWGGYDETGSWDGYNFWELHVSTLWGPSDQFGTPNETLGQQDYTMPSWLDNGRLLLTNINSAFIKQVAVYAIGGGDNTMVQWFSDPSVGSLESGVASRDGTKLAFAAGSASSAATTQIRLYTTQGLPSGNPSDPLPPDPTPVCGIDADQVADPSFAPDGNSLTWAEPDGLHVANVANLGDCTSLDDHLVVAGGIEPSWGPANVNLANKPAPPTSTPPSSTPASTPPAGSSGPPPTTTPVSHPTTGTGHPASGPSTPPHPGPSGATPPPTRVTGIPRGHRAKKHHKRPRRRTRRH